MANPGIQAVAWSPLGSHLLTWQRPQKAEEGVEQRGNLIVWDAASGRRVTDFPQRSYSRDVRCVYLCLPSSNPRI
jgi:translation initiation factor 2A